MHSDSEPSDQTEEQEWYGSSTYLSVDIKARRDIDKNNAKRDITDLLTGILMKEDTNLSEKKKKQNKLIRKSIYASKIQMVSLTREQTRTAMIDDKLKRDMDQ